MTDIYDLIVLDVNEGGCTFVFQTLQDIREHVESWTEDGHTVERIRLWRKGKQSLECEGCHSKIGNTERCAGYDYIKFNKDGSCPNYTSEVYDITCKGCKQSKGYPVCDVCTWRIGYVPKSPTQKSLFDFGVVE